MDLNRHIMLLVTLVLFTFFEGHFFFKSCRNHFLQFYGIRGSKVLNFLVTLNGVLNEETRTGTQSDKV